MDETNDGFSGKIDFRNAFRNEAENGFFAKRDENEVSWK